MKLIRFGASPSQRMRWFRFVVTAMLAMAALCSASAAGAVDANRATVEELQTVRGIGPKTALLIVRERERGGPFESLSDLSDRVRGIGPKRVRRMQAGGLGVGAPWPEADGIAVPALNLPPQKRGYR